MTTDGFSLTRADVGLGGARPAQLFDSERYADAPIDQAAVDRALLAVALRRLLVEERKA